MRESQLRLLFAWMAASQALWWFVWQAFGRTEIAPQLALITVILWAILSLVPQRFYAKLEFHCENRIHHFAMVVGALCLAHSVLFFLVPRAFNDTPGLLESGQFLYKNGFERFLSEYFQLPWVGRVHPPLLTILVSPWIGVGGPATTSIEPLFVVIALAALLAVYQLASLQGGARLGLLAVMGLIGTRYFWLYLTTPGWAGIVVLSVTVAHIGCYFLSRGEWRGLFFLVVGLTVGLYSNYLTLLIIPSLLGWLSRRPKYAVTIVGAILMSLMVFSPWVAYVQADGTQMRPLSMHLPIRPKFLGKNVVFDKSSGYLEMEHLPLRPGRLKGRLIKTMGSVTSQGVAFLVLLVVMAWRGGREVLDISTLLWLGAGLLSIFLIPISRYAIPAFPAIAIVLARCMKSLPPGWASKLLLLCIGIAMLTAYQHPAKSYHLLHF